MHRPPPDDIFTMLWRLSPVAAAVLIAALLGLMDL